MLANIPSFAVCAIGLMAIVLAMSGMAILIVLLGSSVYVLSFNGGGTSIAADRGLSVVAFLVGKLWMAARLRMLVLYNGIGGAAAAAALLAGRAADATEPLAALVGALIGVVLLSSSLIAWITLDGIIDRPGRMGGQRAASFVVMATALAVGGYIVCSAQDGADPYLLLSLVVLILGALVVLPASKMQMPVMISIHNAIAGLVIGVEGFALQSPALMAAGGMVGVARLALTLLMVSHGDRKTVSPLGGTGTTGRAVSSIL